MQLQVCWKCEATKGNVDMTNTYTDVRDQAPWKATEWATVPWATVPELTHVRGFHIQMLASDLLHTWHLGCGRDLLGSCLKVLVSLRYFPGRSIEKSLAHATSRLKRYAKLHKCTLVLRKLTKMNINWSDYPEMKCKGFDTYVLLSWLQDEFSSNPPTSDDPETQNTLDLMCTAVWCMDSWLRMLMHAPMHLTDSQQQQKTVLGTIFMVSYMSLAQRAVVEGKKLRKRSLKYAGLHPCTLRAYRTALDRFLAYTRKKRLKLSKTRHLDCQMSEFIDMLYQEGEPMSYAGHLLSAVKRFFPQLRLQLPSASQLFRKWQRCYTPSRALPASWALVEALMGVAFQQDEPLLALLFAVAFNCLLRTSELLALTHRHLVVHSDRKAVSVILPGSKTSQGNPQVLLITDPNLVKLVNRLVCPASRSLLWNRGPYQFRQRFSGFLEVLAFGPQDYTPYCLRRGGATWYFQSSLSMDATVARGRWACSRTARQYVDEGSMQLAQIQWTPAQKAQVRAWQRRCRTFRLRQ
eukprot:s2703_g8.t1